MNTTESLPQQYVDKAHIYLTARCNLDCHHCLRGQPKANDLPVNDVDLFLGRFENPLLTKLFITGGEPRIHPQFETVMQVFRRFYENRNIRFYTQATIEEIVKWHHTYNQFQDPFLANLRYSPEEFNQYFEAIENLTAININPCTGRYMSMKLYTNGHGLEDAKSATRILNQLCRLGFDEVAVSADIPHQHSANQANIKIDYPLIEKISESHSQAQEEKARLGIDNNIRVQKAGVGAYIIPLGKAKDMPWHKRIELARSSYADDSSFASARSRLQADLKEEFKRWPEIQYYSHCYCNPTYFRRDFDRINAYPPELRIHRWTPLINPDLSVNLCLLGVLPPVGNLHGMTVQQIYEKAAASELYKIIASEGPQGLAEKVGKQFPEGLEKAFWDLTPCGMCQSIQETHGQETAALLNTSSN